MGIFDNRILPTQNNKKTIPPAFYTFEGDLSAVPEWFMLDADLSVGVTPVQFQAGLSVNGDGELVVDTTAMVSAGAEPDLVARVCIGGRSHSPMAVIGAGIHWVNTYLSAARFRMGVRSYDENNVNTAHPNRNNAFDFFTIEPDGKWIITGFDKWGNSNPIRATFYSNSRNTIFEKSYSTHENGNYIYNHGGFAYMADDAWVDEHYSYLKGASADSGFLKNWRLRTYLEFDRASEDLKIILHSLFLSGGKH